MVQADNRYSQVPVFRPSPSQSLLSTPELVLLDTPDTYVSDDFEVPFPFETSNNLNNLNTFGQDKPIFDDAYFSSSQELYGLLPMFPVDGDVGTFGVLPDPARSGEIASGPGVFLTSSELSLTQPVSGPSASPAPVVGQDSSQHCRNFSHSSSSNDSSFAVATQARGRKRKNTTTAESADYEPKATMTRGKQADVEAGSAKAKLRAKNTEAAARSRARKKAKLEEAESRIEELEAENALLREQVAEQERRLADYQS